MSSRANSNRTSSTIDGEVIWMIHVEVSDCGVGISKDMQRQLFEPFRQAQRLAGGTGLGLFSLSKRLDALQGEYGVKDREDGKQGSVFWFAFPYRPDDVAATLEGPYISRNNSFNSFLSKEFSTNSRAQSVTFETEAEPHEFIQNNESNVSQGIERAITINTSTTFELDDESRKSTKLKILLVDDSPSILKMTTKLLSAEGHIVIQANNGFEAITLLDRNDHEFDLMLTDLQMPVLDGIETIKRIRFREYKATNRAQQDAERAKQMQIPQPSSTGLEAETKSYHVTSNPALIPTTLPSPTAGSIIKKDEAFASTDTMVEALPVEVPVTLPKSLFIIACSASNDPISMEEAFEAGANEFLVKPIKPKVVYEILASHKLMK